MNVLSRAAVLSLSVVGLAACATTGETARVSPDTRTIVADEAYISAVEQIARRRGIEVMWVNPPTTEEGLVAQND
ncbi:MAG: hypothetical protein ACREPV_05105 [Lysobacter sp.]